MIALATARRSIPIWAIVLVLGIGTGLIPLMMRHRHPQPPATVGELVDQEQSRHSDWRVVRIHDRADDRYLIRTDYQQGNYFPPYRLHIHRWAGLVHVRPHRLLGEHSPASDDTGEHFLVLGDVELFGDKEMLRQIHDDLSRR